MKTRVLLAFLLAVAGFGICSAHAQDWPDKPVRIVVPFPPAGVPDILMRIVGERLKDRLGKPVVVENRVGASGNIGSEAVAKSPPDGYTFLVGSAGTHAIHATLYRSLPFDPIKDFDPVTLLAIVPNVLVVTNKFPAHSLSEFIAFARSNPGRVNYGSIGNGSSQHLAGAQFEKAAGVSLTHVPYKNVSQVVADLIGGQIDAMFQLVPNIARQVKAGQVRAIAVTAKSRSASLPGVPTIAESGIPDFDTAGWFGVFAPAATPKPIVERMSREINAILELPDVREQVLKYGVEPKPMSPADFRQFTLQETERWRAIVRASGAQID
jgi:tripartite-type tricarboxylate transporter receptor subunit TctC